MNPHPPNLGVWAFRVRAYAILIAQKGSQRTERDGSHIRFRETLCESGRCIDALKKRGRVLKKRRRVLKKVCLVKETGGGPLLQKGGGGRFFKRGGMVLKNPVEDHWRSLKSSTPSRRPSRVSLPRAALKGTNLRGQTPICGFLRKSAVFCGFLRKSAVFCISQMLCFLRKGENLQESAKISEKLRLGSVCPFRFVPLRAP